MFLVGLTPWPNANLHYLSLKFNKLKYSFGLSLLAVLVAAALIIVLIGTYPIPSFTAVQARYQPSDGQLLDRHGAVIHELRIHTNGRRLSWLPLSDISPTLLKTVIAAEDKHFYGHWGVDLLALAKSAWDAAWGRSGRGASTLSMQLAG